MTVEQKLSEHKKKKRPCVCDQNQDDTDGQIVWQASAAVQPHSPKAKQQDNSALYKAKTTYTLTWGEGTM